jgi:hypothetical protein
MLFDISPQDFAHHVRHANSYVDVAERCGYEIVRRGSNSYSVIIKYIKQKILNMRLNTEHFLRQYQVPDDVFKTIIRESTCLSHVLRKCKVSNIEKEKVLKRIEDLGIDIKHLKIKKRNGYKCCSKLDAIDDETFKTLVHNNRNWTDLALVCGYEDSVSGTTFKTLNKRVEMLGLDTNHFSHSTKALDNDKIFV